MPASPLSRGLLLGSVILLAILTGCSSNDPVSRGRIAAFDSRIDLTLIGINRQRAAEVTEILAEDFRLMEAAWHAWQSSPVTRMNALFNESDQPFAAPPSVLPLLKLSKQIAAQSDQLFNPAIGHLERAWGFQGRAADCLQPPPEDLIEQVLADRPTMDDIHIDGFRVRSDNQTVKLDFRAIQRGFAIDRAMARLREMGVHHASISIDGNVHVIGSRDGHPWSIGVRGPAGGGIFATLQLSGNEAAFTAGQYQNNFTWEGEVYHDIIDPRTGYPARGTASVTVVHPNASTADAAATALFIAGPGDWHRLARKMGIRYVMLTDTEGRVYMNPAMQSRVKLQRGNHNVIISEPLS
jgi:thiamine biosynthesis lipoprotein